MRQSLIRFRRGTRAQLESSLSDWQAGEPGLITDEGVFIVAPENGPANEQTFIEFLPRVLSDADTPTVYVSGMQQNRPFGSTYTTASGNPEGFLIQNNKSGSPTRYAIIITNRLSATRLGAEYDEAFHQGAIPADLQIDARVDGFRNVELITFNESGLTNLSVTNCPELTTLTLDFWGSGGANAVKRGELTIGNCPKLNTFIANNPGAPVSFLRILTPLPSLQTLALLEVGNWDAQSLVDSFGMVPDRTGLSSGSITLLQNTGTQDPVFTNAMSGGLAAELAAKNWTLVIDV